MYHRMPFGKHKGEYVTDVPTDYLEWCLRKEVIKDDLLSNAVRAELRQRYAERDVERYREPAAPPEDWGDVLRRVHRELVMRFHPDRGGSHEAMVAVNACFERLGQLLETR